MFVCIYWFHSFPYRISLMHGHGLFVINFIYLDIYVHEFISMGF